MRTTCIVRTLLLLLAPWCAAGAQDARDGVGDGQQQHHNNWAVLVCTSRYWFNYRHVANTLAMHRTARGLGIPDDHIILMLADDIPCNARNAYRGQMYLGDSSDSYGCGVEVDYRGESVSADAFLRVLTGRVHAAAPPSQRLDSDADSHVLIYLSGHGGDGFLKFQDTSEVSAHEIGAALDDMHLAARYRRALVIVDTCQAGSLFARVTAPRVLCVGSSATGENSYAHRVDAALGLPTMDRFTSATADFFAAAADAEAPRGEGRGRRGGHTSIGDLLRWYNPRELRSTPVVHATEGAGRALADAVPAAAFFGAQPRIQLTYDGYPGAVL